MNNNLKLTLSMAVFGLLATGCGKDKVLNLADAASKIELTPGKPESTKFKVTSNTFKNGEVDYEQLKKDKVNGPQLSWENTPAGTKGFWVVMDDGANHVYWTQNFGANFNDFKESKIQLPWSYPESFAYPVGEHGTNASIEIFALDCTPVEFTAAVQKKANSRASIFSLTAAGLKDILDKNSLSNLVLGSAKVSYPIKKSTPSVAKAPTTDSKKQTFITDLTASEGDLNKLVGLAPPRD